MGLVGGGSIKPKRGTGLIQQMTERKPLKYTSKLKTNIDIGKQWLGTQKTGSRKYAK